MRTVVALFWWALLVVFVRVVFNFQIPYLLCLLLLGLPLFFMEMALGQYSGTSCTKVASGQPVTVLEACPRCFVDLPLA